MELIATDNLTNPGAAPVNGDVVRRTYRRSNGKLVTEEQTHIDITLKATNPSDVLIDWKVFWSLFAEEEFTAIVQAKRNSATAEEWFIRLQMLGQFTIKHKSAQKILTAAVNQGYITAERRAQIEVLQQPE